MVKRIPVIVSLMAVLLPTPLHATSLYLDPPTKNYVVGETVSVRVIVSSEEDINAVSGRLIVPTDVFEPLSISKQGSIVDLWLQEPAVSSRGEIVFEGLILGDGFSGVETVFTIYLRALGTQNATLQFAEGLVLASDGLGTNVLDRIEGTTFTFQTVEGRRTAEGLQELPEGVPALASGVPQERLFAPTVIEYSGRIASLQSLRIRGVTYPEAVVLVALQEEGSETIDEHETASDAGGNFNYRYQEANRTVSQTAAIAASVIRFFDPDVYHFWLRAEKDNLISSPTQVFEVLVGGFDFGTLFSESANVLVVTALLAILAIFVSVLGIYGWHYLRKLRKRLEEKK